MSAKTKIKNIRADQILTHKHNILSQDTDQPVPQRCLISSFAVSCFDSINHIVSMYLASFSGFIIETSLGIDCSETNKTLFLETPG